MAFDPTADPLGLGLQQRANQTRWNNIYQGLNPVNSIGNPMWDPWFQAVNEAADGKAVQYGVTPDQTTTDSKDVGLDPNDPTPLSIQMLRPQYSNQLGQKMLVQKRTGGQSNMPKVPTSGYTGFDPTSQTT